MPATQHQTDTPLREGFTTGTAAAAAAYAAVLRLFGHSQRSVRIALPPFALQEGTLVPGEGKRESCGDNGGESGGDNGGESRGENGKNGQAQCLRLAVPVKESVVLGNIAHASVIKDGGDDPDATHGAHIFAYVSTSPFTDGCAPEQKALQPLSAPITVPGAQGVFLYGGEGVGTVSLPGLPVMPGEAAINPEPRKQIAFAVQEAAARFAYAGPLHVCICVPDGEARAKHTMNARLGILGGISILGTRGTVKPYSHDAWKATIAQGLSVASALALPRILLSTGRRSERLACGLYEKNTREYPALPAAACVQVADFAAFAIRSASVYAFSQIVWACFPGKLLKLAQGLEWTHASAGEADMTLVARLCAEAGAAPTLLATVAAMPTATGAFAAIREASAAVHDAVLARLAERALGVLTLWRDEALAPDMSAQKALSPETLAPETLAPETLRPMLRLHVFSTEGELLLTL